MTPATESGFGRLEQNDEMQAEQIATLTAGVEELRGAVADLKAKAVDMQGRQISMEGVLSRNTEVTEALLVIAGYYEALGKGISWLARKAKVIAGWVAVVGGAIVAVIQAWQHVRAWLK